MIDEQLKEDAGLYALGMLESPERDSFERKLGDLPDLRAYVAEVEHMIAGVALTAPSEEVDPVVLERINAQIGQTGRRRLNVWTRSLMSSPGGWPAAAALVLFLAIAAVRYEMVQDALLKAESERDAVVREMRNIIEVLDGASGGDGAGSLFDSELLSDGAGATSSNLVQAAERRSYRLLQNFDRVNLELARVRNREAQRAAPHPGIARPMVVSMWDPEVSPDERGNAHMLSQEISDIIGDKLEATGAVDDDSDSSEAEIAPTAQPASMSFDSWPEVEVTGDALAPLWFTRDLPIGPSIRHKNFPINSWEELGLIRFENGSFYHSDSDLLYSPSINGTDFLGNRPPDGFDPDSGVTQAPAVRAEIVDQPEPDETSVESADQKVPMPKAFTLYDETTGEGSIILQNLPPRSEALSYHLWLNDAQADAPIEVGVLPDLDGGDGRVFFDLQPGLSPSGYILTAEPSGEIPEAPSGEIVLYGP